MRLRNGVSAIGTSARSAVKQLIPRNVLARLRELLVLAPEARSVYLRLLLWRVVGRSKRRAPATLVGAESILFICHGNIMRSALATAALYERSRGSQRMIRVRSAGLHAKLDKPADVRMRKAALALGISLESHRATPLSSDLIDAADAVFVMDYLNEAETIARFPTAREKLWLLGGLVPTAEEGEVIPDPYTGDEEAAARCAARVCGCIDTLMSLLTQPPAIQPRSERRSTAAK